MLNHLFVVATLLQYTRLTGPAVPFVSTLKYSVTRLLCTAGRCHQNGKLKILENDVIAPHIESKAGISRMYAIVIYRVCMQCMYAMYISRMYAIVISSCPPFTCKIMMHNC